MGGHTSNPEGSRLHPPLLLVYQGTAGLIGTPVTPDTKTRITQVGKGGEGRQEEQLELLWWNLQPRSPIFPIALRLLEQLPFIKDEPRTREE